MPSNHVKRKKRVSSKEVSVHDFFELMLYDKIAPAIVETLVKSLVPDGLRYNQLFKTTKETLKKNEGIMQMHDLTGRQGKKERKLNLNSFNERLKKLVAMGMITRIEENRFNVKYQIPFLKELNEEEEFLSDLKEMKEFKDYIGGFTDKIDEILQKHRLEKLDKKIRVDVIGKIIRTLVYMVTLHIVTSMYLGVREGRKGEGKFVAFSSMLAKDYRDIVLRVLFCTVYVSRVPEALECLKGIMEELEKVKIPNLADMINQIG